MLMFERLRTQGAQDGAAGDTLNRVTPEIFNRTEVVCFKIDNVAQYYNDVVRTRQDADFFKHFPNLAPPFKTFWMEFPVSTRGGELGNGAIRNGVLFRAITKDDEIAVGDYKNKEVIGRLMEMLRTDTIKWLVIALPFIEYDFGICGPFGSYVIPVHDDGVIELNIRRFTGSPVERGMITFLHAIGESVSKDVAVESGVSIDEARKRVSSMIGDEGLFPAFLAVAFLHCKGVVTYQNDQQLTRQYRRDLVRRGERPPVRYSTLAIEPMKNVLRNEGGVQHHGLAKALHICRGHFRTYTAAAPMLGHYVGTVWVPSHVRGRDEDHVVEKTYEINTPDNDPIPGDIDSAFRSDGNRKQRGRNVN